MREGGEEGSGEVTEGEGSMWGERDFDQDRRGFSPDCVHQIGSDGGSDEEWTRTP
jgi:hypothetical protein